MKAYKKITAGLCAAMLCLGMAGCGSSSSDDKKSETTSKANEITMKEEDKQQLEETSSKLDDKELENKTIKFFSHWDMNPGDGQVVPPGIQMFRDKYDGKIEWVQTTWDNRYDDLAALVMANDSPDYFSAGDMDGFPKGAIKGMFQPIDDYIDVNSDLWAPAKNVLDGFLFDGGHYVAATGAYPHYVCVYNTTTISENGYEDPAELFHNDEWTWSKFTEMVEDFTDPENDVYGLDGWWYPYALSNSCGKPFIGLENGKLVSNLEDPNLAKAQNMLEELRKHKVGFDRASNGGSTRGDGTTGNGLGTYQTLFIPVGLWGIENSPENVTAFGDVEAGEIMFVPMPRMDDSDTYYVTCRPDGFFLVKNAPNPEGFAALMNCQMLAASDAKEITVKQLKDDYKWNDDMIAMRQEILDLANAHPIFDFSEAVSAELQNVMVQQVMNATSFGEDPWSTVVESNKDQVDFYLDEANQKIDVDAEKAKDAE